jgi:hypothetical protein
MTNPFNLSFDEFEKKEGLNQLLRMDIFELQSLFFISIYTALFFFGILSNLMIIYFVCIYKRMQTLTNKLITNLCVADFVVVIICIPITTSHYVFQDWIFGEFICQISDFSKGNLYKLYIFHKNFKLKI